MSKENAEHFIRGSWIMEIPKTTEIMKFENNIFESNFESFKHINKCQYRFDNSSGETLIVINNHKSFTVCAIEADYALLKYTNNVYIVLKKVFGSTD